jgi:hypothetical protein
MLEDIQIVQAEAFFFFFFFFGGGGGGGGGGELFFGVFWGGGGFIPSLARVVHGHASLSSASTRQVGFCESMMFSSPDPHPALRTEMFSLLGSHVMMIPYFAMAYLSFDRDR